MGSTRAGAMHRRLVVAGGAIALAALVIAAPASATGPVKERFDYPLEFLGTVECGTFQDNYIDRYQVAETDVFDASGSLVRIEYKVVHTSVDRNSVTGVTLEEHGRFNEVDDYVAGTITVTGNQEIANRAGRGAVIQDVGRLVFSMDTGELMFFAGGRKHSQTILGDGIWCDALS